MKYSQPLVLLLGSVLAASCMGCSAITAIVSDSRPENRKNHDDAGRLAAIGRVFENQGRYDRAEAMYRKALKNRPQDPELRSQLQQLAERQRAQKFGPTETSNAIALADSVSPAKSGALPPVRRTASATSVSSTSPVSTRVASTEVATVVQRSPIPAPEPMTDPVAPKDSSSPIAPSQIELTSGGSQGWRSSQQHVINSGGILIALKKPDDHVDLLLNALNRGDGAETKSLAATLLGDCDPANSRIRDALVQHQASQSDPEILVALCDSQIERKEADQQTVNCLISLCAGFGSEIQIQAASQLRNFAGTEHEISCMKTLKGLLENVQPNVRATAAVTLGDFASLDRSTITRLRELSEADADPNVREAAQSALTRQTGSRSFPRSAGKQDGNLSLRVRDANSDSAEFCAHGLGIR